MLSKTYTFTLRIINTRRVVLKSSYEPYELDTETFTGDGM
jgi:hypothetical protein